MTKRTSVLITDIFTAETNEILRESCEVRRSANHMPTAQELAGVHSLLIRSRTKIDHKLLQMAPDLQTVVTATSGYDHVDLEACDERGVKTYYTPDANFNAAAELTILLMLSALRRQSETVKALREYKWKEALRPGRELKGKTLGIVGLGRVGSRVAELAQSFDAEVIAHDPYADDRNFSRLKISRQGLTEVLVQSDIISLHVPLTKETRHIISRGTLEHCKDGFVLINTSRGQVVDEGALVASLESGQITAAGLDVFEHEPLARDSVLRKMPNVVLTPHLGAMTEEALAKASELAALAIIDPKNAVLIPR
jgi:D-3-phosphoglycerate dehydrogenase / 2-oxoglutarate reductase